MRFRVVAVLAFLLSSSPVLAQERVDPIPVGPEKIVKALSPFRGNPDSSQVTRLLEEQAVKSGFPTSDYDHVLIARLWRLAGVPEPALEALAEVEPMGQDTDLAMYERARTWLESDTNRMSGLRAYWSSCGSPDARVRAEIEWDLLAVTIPEERGAWLTVEAGEATCELLRRFWDERALRAAIGRNERIALHYQRLAEVRNHFHLKRPRELNGMSDSFGRPEGLAVDDRGLLLIRLGSPDYEQSCPEEVSGGDLRNLLGLCWVYWRPEGYKIFYLSTRDRFGYDWPYGDYRIQENLSQQAEPGTHLFQKYVMNADLPEGTKHRLVRRGPVYRNAKLALAGVVTEVPDELIDDLDQAENLAFRQEVRDATRRHTSDVLEQIPDSPDVEATVSFRFEALRFLNPSSREWQVWLLNSVRAGDLTPSSDGDPEATLDVAGRYVALNDEGLVAGRMAPLMAPAASVSDVAGLTLRSVLTANPGPLPVTVVIEDLNAPGSGAWIQDTVNVPAIGGLPQLSDIAVAQAEGGTWTRDGETYLQVSPAHMTNPDGTIHTYFEVYGVGPGADYDVELRLVRADDAEDIWRRSANDLAFRLQFRSEMSGDIGRHHLRLELSDTKPGEYMLAIRIQDADTQAYSLPAITDVFVAKN